MDSREQFIDKQKQSLFAGEPIPEGFTNKPICIEVLALTYKGLALHPGGNLVVDFELGSFGLKWVVSHIQTGRRLHQWRLKSVAMKYLKAVAELTDWEHAELMVLEHNTALQEQVKRIMMDCVAEEESEEGFFQYC